MRKGREESEEREWEGKKVEERKLEEGGGA